MSIGGTRNGPSAGCNQAAGELDLFDAFRLISDLNQQYPVLYSNHYYREAFRLHISIQIQAADPAAVIDFSVPGRAELGEHIEADSAITEHTSFVDRRKYENLANTLLITVRRRAQKGDGQPRC